MMSDPFSLIPSAVVQVATFPVSTVAEESLVDMSGAGDAFVGGFLSQIVLGKDVPHAVGAGHFAANTVIQRRGVTHPEACDWTPRGAKRSHDLAFGGAEEEV